MPAPAHWRADGWRWRSFGERLKLTGVAVERIARSNWSASIRCTGRSFRAQPTNPTRCAFASPGRTENLREAVRIGNEVETLYTNGPAAGGGACKSARDVVAVAVRCCCRANWRSRKSSFVGA